VRKTTLVVCDVVKLALFCVERYCLRSDTDTLTLRRIYSCTSFLSDVVFSGKPSRDSRRIPRPSTGGLHHYTLNNKRKKLKRKKKANMRRRSLSLPSAASLLLQPLRSKKTKKTRKRDQKERKCKCGVPLQCIRVPDTHTSVGACLCVCFEYHCEAHQREIASVCPASSDGGVKRRKESEIDYCARLHFSTVPICSLTPFFFYVCYCTGEK
jgi:hypothetical protein